MRTAHIITIGHELLIGDTVNTNASWIGQQLTDLGLEVVQIQTVGDDEQRLRDAIERGRSDADLLITTGGLGPTHDDITKKVVAELTGARMVVHEPTLKFIKKVFEKRNIPFTESNYQQAEVLDKAEVLFNKQGTAPGMWLHEDGVYIGILPGVPQEMKHLMREKILSKIGDLTEGRSQRFSRYLLTAGIGESTLSDRVIGSLGDYLDGEVAVAYLPSPQGVRIRVSAFGRDKSRVGKKLDAVCEHIYTQAGKYIVGEGKELTLSEGLGRLLRERHLSIAAAESCTGGLLMDTLTDIPGSSDYIAGGVVAYANRIKTNLLGVDEKDLATFGAVSKTVALQMAEAAGRRLEADIGVSTTGIAGPGGGTPEKPVGTVWIGYWSGERHFAIRALLTNDRLINKERSVAIALETVRRTLLDIEPMPYGLEIHPS